jgi:hypothetical protein
VNDFLDEKRREITARLDELKPLVDEYNSLQAAATALAGVGGKGPRTTGARRRGPGRPRAATTRAGKARASKRTTKATAKRPGRPPGRRRAGRRKGSGTRAAEALGLVRGQPGITIPELAQKMGIKQNYLYRVLPSLHDEGKVSKRGRGWHPKA